MVCQPDWRLPAATTPLPCCRRQNSRRSEAPALLGAAPVRRGVRPCAGSLDHDRFDGGGERRGAPPRFCRVARSSSWEAPGERGHSLRRSSPRPRHAGMDPDGFPWDAALGPHGDAVAQRQGSGTGGSDSAGSVVLRRRCTNRTRTWTPGGPLNTARRTHTATLLPNGRVLIAAGAGFGGWLSSAEVHDPDSGTSGTSTPTGSLAAGRLGSHGDAPGDRMVLVAGGWDGRFELTSAEV